MEKFLLGKYGKRIIGICLRIKKFFSTIILIIILIPFILSIIHPVIICGQNKRDFFVGATVDAYLAKRVWDVWKKFDPLPLLRQNGFKWIRVSLTTKNSPELKNTPVSQWNTLPWRDEFWCSLEYVEQIFKEASEVGMKLNLVFLLSHEAAHAGTQNAPPEWRDLTVEETASVLEEYCYHITKYFRDKGINIEIYDVGSEIEYGILNFRPDERVYRPPDIDITTNVEYMKNNIWNKEAVMLKSAIKGIKRANPNAKIVLHIDTVGFRPENYLIKGFFKTMVEEGVSFDYAGLSLPYMGYYEVPQPYFKSAQFKEVINFIESLGKKIIISEFSYPHDPRGTYGTYNIPDPTYPLTPEGQAKWVRDFLSFCKNENNIAGVFYFYADYFPGMQHGHPIELEYSGLFANETEVLPAMLEFRTNLETFSLKVEKIGSGSGLIKSDPVGIYCGPDCLEDFIEGTSVNLMAIPDTGSIFIRWGNACSGIDICKLFMDGDKTVTALFVNPLTIGISNSTFWGEVGVPFNISLQLAGGVPPYTTSVIKGILPPGLNLDSDKIKGTPEQAGTFSFVIKVTDDFQYWVTKKFIIKIFKPLGITTNILKNGKVGRNYNSRLRARGGKKPYSWSLISGNLPEGLNLDSLTGKITGLPIKSGRFELKFQVSDDLGGNTVKDLWLEIE